MWFDPNTLLKAGIPSALCVYLVFSVIQDQKEAREIQRQSTAGYVEMAKSIAAFAQDHSTLKGQLEKLVQVSVQNCINQGKTDESRQACVP